MSRIENVWGQSRKVAGIETLARESCSCGHSAYDHDMMGCLRCTCVSTDDDVLREASRKTATRKTGSWQRVDLSEANYTMEEELRWVAVWEWDGNEDIYIEDSYIVREVETLNQPEVRTAWVVDEEAYFSWIEEYEYGEGSPLFYDSVEKASEAAKRMAESVQPYMFADYEGK